jgi:hypothetical protein
MKPGIDRPKAMKLRMQASYTSSSVAPVGVSGRFGRTSYKGTKVICPSSSAITMASVSKDFPI